MTHPYPENDQFAYQEAYRIAQKRVKAKMEFFMSLASYIVVNPILFLIWLNSGGDNSIDFSNGINIHSAGSGSPWFLWVLLGWGIGLLLHFLRVFVFTDQGSQQMVEREMKKMGAITPPQPYYPAQPTGNNNDLDRK